MASLSIPPGVLGNEHRSWRGNGSAHSGSFSAGFRNPPERKRQSCTSVLERRPVCRGMALVLERPVLLSNKSLLCFALPDALWVFLSASLAVWLCSQTSRAE